MAGALGTRELRTILDIVREVSGAASLADFRAMVPRLILTAVAGNMAGYNEIDVETGDVFITWSPLEAASADDVQKFGQYALDHPSLQHINRTGDGSAVAISDLIGREQYRETRLYREVFAGLGAEDQLVVGLPAPRPIVIGVPINRDSWGFRANERATLNELRPHLAQAHATVAVRDLLTAAVQSRDAALDLTGHGVIRLQRGRVIDASPTARRWLDRGLLEDGRLSDELLSWYAAQRGRLDHDRPELAAPFQTPDVAVRLVDGDTLLVEEHPSPPAVAELRRLGLTTAEAAVLAGVVAGSSTREVAGSLHIATSTVRKHLQSVYRKLGVHSRAAAVAVALNARSAAYRRG